MPGKILVIDDDIALTRTIEKILIDAGYIPLLAHTAEDGIRLTRSDQPDLILLDVMVPSMGGWEACRRLRALSAVPIIFLTALSDVQNVVHGLEIGADDYLVKPIDSAELSARIKAYLRRTGAVVRPEEKLVFGGGALTIDLSARLVRVSGQAVELTPREFELLTVLATNPGKVITTADLVNRAWGMADEAAVQNIKPYIHYLRKKIEADPAGPRWILTVRGVGYRFAES